MTRSHIPHVHFACILIAFYCIIGAQSIQAQNSDYLSESTFTGLEWRGIGPAFMSGRISDIAIHPEDDNTWYVTVGSGGVWKTQNAGVTWQPLWDDQSVYSIGCVTIDPHHPSTVWIGTGEDVGGRHLSWGDGIYRSDDGGASWKHMGLRESEHISKIVVHPHDPDIIWVAAQGPLWSSGGERGVYMSEDGGQSWTRTLGDDMWTGATELVVDPDDPQTLYAATWDRHRTVAAYMGGGPGSGLHRSADGGKTWSRLSSGLPTSRMGKIGLALSPHDSDILYAAIELDQRSGAVYRSLDRGATWKMMSETVSGATGPHYYQELYACPHVKDRIYLMDVRVQVSDDGGATFRRMQEEHKHSDNHAMAFRADDPDYLLIGSDGGLYESFDLAANWRYMANLPLTQFYKIAVDDAEPFYNIYGGTQDNSTEGGPSRTDNWHGIQNSDWRVVLNWDGHQPATEPGNPDIMYGQRQQGTLSRIDLSTGEVTDIQPQSDEGEDYERYNWDAPILVSPHSPTTIYFASQRLWKSTDRGNNWTALSADLTRHENRISLPIMGAVQSYDNAWDIYAMSNYNTITSIAVSHFDESHIFLGTDDGLVQITTDGGDSWSRVDVSSIRGIPARAYVNDIKTDLHDADVVYMALDHHKTGDYSPYLLRSDDAGKSWKMITDGLGDENIVWRIVQDDVDPELLFAGTEWGVYFSSDGGEQWIKMSGGMPTISVRDLAIQRREHDLVAGTFGRGFYVLDDYRSLRDIGDSDRAFAQMFPIRDAWWYIPRSHLGFETEKGNHGADHYVAPNPDFGALITYYLPEDDESPADKRRKKEKENLAALQVTSYETLDQENEYQGPNYKIEIRDAEGQVVRRIDAHAGKGMHRVAWDLRRSSPLVDSWMSGMLVPPGTYSAQLVKVMTGKVSPLADPQSIIVKPLYQSSIPAASEAEREDFWQRYTETVRRDAHTSELIEELSEDMTEILAALSKTPSQAPKLYATYQGISDDLQLIKSEVAGSPSRAAIGEKAVSPTIGERMFAVYRVLSHSTYGPTSQAEKNLKIVNSALAKISDRLVIMRDSVDALQKDIRKAGGPWLD